MRSEIRHHCSLRRSVAVFSGLVWQWARAAHLVTGCGTAFPTPE